MTAEIKRKQMVYICLLKKKKTKKTNLLPLPAPCTKHVSPALKFKSIFAEGFPPLWLVSSLLVCNLFM